jgi:NAD(P)-dependent dehydrogenase (short-subunit alcohol dehydrogenase family)
VERVASDTLETNLFGAWKLTQAALPLMRKNGYRRIVNLSSEMGQLSDMGRRAPGPGWVRADMGGPEPIPW